MMKIEVIFIKRSHFNECIGQNRNLFVYKCKPIFQKTTNFREPWVYNFRYYLIYETRACQNEEIEKGRSFENSNIEITICFFFRSLTFSGTGGVIYVVHGALSMKISLSMFYQCRCTLDGGAVFFVSANSQLRMVCANRCYCGSSYKYHFAYLCSSFENTIEYLSVSFCTYNTRAWSPIWLDSGIQKFDNTNSSMNKNDIFSGSFFISSSSFISTHCTFSNNNANSNGIWFFSHYGSIIFANIIHNNSPDFRGVTHVDGGTLMMQNCIFGNNQGTLLRIWTGYLQVSNSYISHSDKFSTLTPVQTSSNTFLLSHKLIKDNTISYHIIMLITLYLKLPQFDLMLNINKYKQYFQYILLIIHIILFKPHINLFS